ncbi:MAG: hemerythrin domain-containing protein [Coriobacteriales bacterium]|nr:hemerythrin domain-containing protein [Coriobacteriales bacterium]
MRGPSPAGPLMKEHRLIERVVALLQAELAAIDERGSANTTLIATSAEFLHTYADLCHHGKEEDILFRDLHDKPMTSEDADIMRGLTEDHKLSRRLVGTLVDANRRYANGEMAALGEIRSAASKLVELYPRHIATEDKVFFKPAMEYFTEGERAEMLREYADFDQQLIHDVYRTLVDDAEALAEADRSGD